MSDRNSTAASLPGTLRRLAALPAAQAADAARADQDARWRSGERPPAEAYLDALPAVAADPEQALVLIYGEVLARTDRGERPTLAEYQQRFPQFADRLATQFAVHAAIAAAPPSRPWDAPTLDNLGSESAPSDFSADVQLTISHLGPPGEVAEVGRLAHYRVLRLLGEGGMGMVFLAEDTRLERPVALKVMRPSIAKNPSAYERFLREAKAAAAVKHDHIVTIYQVDEHAGAPFLAMELLDGLPLDQWLKANPTPPLREVVRIARQTADGLAAAHARGLIHRDIKPANLWVEAPSGRVKILDFGLARPANDDTQVSGSGAIVGTPAFMAPEQARGLPVDPRADLFSLGVVLYRMTAGRAPFSGDTVMAILTSLAVDTPMPVIIHNPTVPPTLSGLIDQLLAKDPNDRPGSATDVAEALRRIEAALEFEALPRAVPALTPASADPWQNIDLTEADSTAAPVVPVAAPIPAPVAKSSVARKPRQSSAWMHLAAWSVLGLVLIGLAAAVFVKLREGSTGAAQGGVAKNDGGTKPTYTPPVMPKTEPEGPLPPVFVPPHDDGPSPLDNLDPAAIPASEKFPWQPPELVAVIGTHKLRHWGPVFRIAHSPTGDLVATVGYDGLRLWEAGTLREKGHFPLGQHTENASATHFSPDGWTLALYQPGKGYVFFDVTRNPPEERFHIASINRGYPFSPDGGKVVIDPTGVATTCEVWDITGATPRRTAAFPLTDNKFTNAPMAWTAEGDVLTLYSNDPTLNKWEAVIWKYDGDSATPRSRLPQVTSVYALSMDGKRFAHVSQDGKRVIVHDLRDGTFAENGSFDTPEQALFLQFYPQSDRLLSADNQKWYVRDLRHGATKSYTPTPPNLSIGVHVGLHPDGEHLVTFATTGVGIHGNRMTADGKGLYEHECGPVMSVLPSPAANRVITHETGRTARRWDLDGPQPTAVPLKNVPTWYALAVLADGHVLRHGPELRSLYLVDPHKGDAAEPMELPLGLNEPSTAAVSASGRWLAASSNYINERSPRLYDFRERPPKPVGVLSDFPPMPNSVRDLIFTPAEQFLAAVGAGEGGAPTNLTCVWDLRGSRPKHVATFEAASCAAFALDSPTLAVGFADGKVTLLDYAGGVPKETVAVQPFSRAVMSAVVLPGGNRLLASDDQGRIKFVKLPTGEIEKEWTWPGPARLWLATDGRHVFTANANGTGYVLRLEQAPKAEPSPLDALDRKALPLAEIVPELPPDAVAVIGTHAGKHWGGAWAVTCSADGKLVATGGPDGIVRLFDAAAGKELAALRKTGVGTSGLALTPDGRTLAAAGTGAKVWAIADGKAVLRHDIPAGSYTGVAVSSDGKRLALTEAQKVLTFDISGLKARPLAAVPAANVTASPVFLQTATLVATTDSTTGDNHVNVWDTATGKRLHRFGPFEHYGQIHAARDGRALVQVASDGTVRTWDFSGPAPKESSVKVVVPAGNSLGWSVVSADGSRVVATLGNAVLAWDLTRPAEPLTDLVHPQSPYPALTADGKTAFVCNGNISSVGRIDLTVRPTVWKPLLTEVGYAYPLGAARSGRVAVLTAAGGEWYEPRNRTLAAAGSARNRLAYFGGHEYGVFPLDPSDNSLLTIRHRDEIVQYDLGLADDTPPLRSVKVGAWIRAMAGTPSSATVAVATLNGDDTAVILYRPRGATFDELSRLPFPKRDLRKLRPTADGKTLYLLDGNDPELRLRRWNVAGPKPEEEKLPPGFENLADWDLSRDGRRLVVLKGTEFTTWDVTGAMPRPLARSGGFKLGAYPSAAIGPDGREVVVGGLEQGTNRYWYALYDTATGAKRREWVLPGVAVFQFTLDGRHLLTSNSNGTGYVIRLRGGPVPVKP